MFALSVFLLFFSTLQAHAEEDCTSSLNSLSGTLDAYQAAAESKQWENAKSTQNQIHAILDSHLHDACFEKLWSTYLVRSMSFLDASRVDKNALRKNEVVENNQLQFKKLVEFLISQKIIEPLTPELRHQFGERWEKQITNTNTQSSSPYQIYGAYDCLQPKIYIDTSLSSYDVGATLIHEISHLTRDKFDVFLNDGEPESIQDQILLDEYLSSLQAAFIQVFQLPRSKFFLDVKVIFRERFFRTFETQLGGDLSLFNRSGWVPNLDRGGQAYELVGNRYHPETLPRYENLYVSNWNQQDWFFPFLYSIHDAQKQWGLRITSEPVEKQNWLKHYLLNNIPMKTVVEALRSTLDTVEHSYFPGMKTNPKLLDLHFIKFENDVFVPNNYSPNRENAYRNETRVDALDPIGAVLSSEAFLNQLKTNLFKVSQSCLNLQKAVEDHELDSYLGTGLKPGGIKPPGVEGSRPEGPHRPGVEGSRPSVMVHPCLQIEGGL